MKKQASQPQNPQSGSVFIWIFVMIALFGALSFAMIQSGRQGASNLSTEKARLRATEIIDYGNKLDDAVKKLRINNGCTETQMGFDNTVWETYGGVYTNGPNYNPSTPADGSCQMFKASGAGLQAITFEGNGIPPSPSLTKSGHIWVSRVNISNLGSTKEDVIAWYPYVDKNVCIEINKLLGVENPNGLPPDDMLTPEVYRGYDGTFDEASGTIGLAPSLTGKKAFCFHWGAMTPLDAYQYHYMHALWTR